MNKQEFEAWLNENGYTMPQWSNPAGSIRPWDAVPANAVITVEPDEFIIEVDAKNGVRSQAMSATIVKAAK